MNIYKKYRKKAGLTQEKASEKLMISVDSLKGYECNIRVPHDDMVAKMCVLYSDSRLAYEHLARSSVGCLVLDEIHDRSLSCSTVSFMYELKRFEALGERILCVTSDDIISNEEAEEWLMIISELRKLTTAAHELMLYRIGGK